MTAREGAEIPATDPAKRETWADWLPHHPPALTIEELLARAKGQGIDCDLRTLRLWQTQGVLPYPIRKRKGSGVYAIYPTAALNFIELLREMQGQGLKLEDIGPRLRARALGNRDQDLHEELIMTIQQAARIQAQLSGAAVTVTHVTFTDDVGLKMSYNIGVPVRVMIPNPGQLELPDPSRTQEEMQ